MELIKIKPQFISKEELNEITIKFGNDPEGLASYLLGHISAQDDSIQDLLHCKLILLKFASIFYKKSIEELRIEGFDLPNLIIEIRKLLGDRNLGVN